MMLMLGRLLLGWWRGLLGVARVRGCWSLMMFGLLMICGPVMMLLGV